MIFQFVVENLFVTRKLSEISGNRFVNSNERFRQKLFPCCVKLPGGENHPYHCIKVKRLQLASSRSG